MRLRRSTRAMRLGLVAAGFLAGFASSTAAIAALGRQVRKQPERAELLAAAATWFTAAPWVLDWMLAILLAGALAIDAALALAPIAGAGLACTLAPRWPIATR